MATVSALIVLLLANWIVLTVDTKRNDPPVLSNIDDIKDFKKLIRTKTNVLVLFSRTESDAGRVLPVFTEVADLVRGQGTMVFVDCSSEAKKLCRKLKVNPEGIVLKHYKNGEFHKDYDRKETVQSMLSFMRDPGGDVPWDEDSTADDIVHVADAMALGKLLKKEIRPIMMMFYAPWCGFCKRLKPGYAEAASEVKSQYVLAAMDVNKPENTIIRQHFNITGFPTLIYFEEGQPKYTYDGEYTKDGIISFMRNPTAPKPKLKDEEWSETPSEVVHLTDLTFDVFLQAESSVLVMFYAPWCGHCKHMKPEYVDAAAKLKALNVEGALAAVDATKETSLGTKFAIKGYPSVKYFSNGQFAFDVSLRTADKIIEFMKDPKEPPPPPPPETPWSETETDVIHFIEETSFRSSLKKKRHALVMFYAPWCGHCKRAKPEFEAAASQFKEDGRVVFGAVDCTEHTGLCSSYEVQGYPTIKYFNYLKNVSSYEGERTEAGFVSFMKDPSQPPPPPPPAPKVQSPEEVWAGLEGAEHLLHLKEATAAHALEERDTALVMFYAPWCGHCNAMKPGYAHAALTLHNSKVDAVLATLDATTESGFARKHDVSGYPTLKLFKFGQVKEEYSGDRSAEDLVRFVSQHVTPKTKQEL